MSFNADSFCGLLPASFVLISVKGGLVALPHHVISAFFNERLVTSCIRECGHWLENASKMTGRRVEGDRKCFERRDRVVNMGRYKLGV